MKCKKCGHEMWEKEEKDESRSSPETSMELGSDAKAKDDVLAELIEAMQGSIGEKLKGGPKTISIEVVKASPKKDEDEEV